MLTQDPPKLKVLLGSQSLDVEDASKQQGDHVLEALIRALLFLPLSIHTLTRIRLGDCFRRSLQSSRQTTPYRLHSIINECKTGMIDKASLEAKFFEYGGVRAVTALAAAAADDKQIVGLLNGLPDAEFQAFQKSIIAIEPHGDFLFIVETVDRKRPSKLSKRKHVPGPRPPRRNRNQSHMAGRIQQAIPKVSVKKGQLHMLSSAWDSRPSRAVAGSPDSIAIDTSPDMLNRTSPVDDLPGASHANRSTGAVADLTRTSLEDQGKPNSNVADPGEAKTNTRPMGTDTLPAVVFQQDKSAETQQLRAIEHTSQGKPRYPPSCESYLPIFHPDDSTFYGMTPDMAGSWQCDGNYRIDLDNLHSMPSYGIDADNPNFEHYGIDLDNFNAL